MAGENLTISNNVNVSITYASDKQENWKKLGKQIEIMSLW